MKAEKKRRHYEIDWVRVLAVLLLILIHTAAIYDPFPITAVKGQPSIVMALFAAFVHEWRLAILFIISGAGTCFALDFLSGSQYLSMRFRRIVIPLLVGTFLFVPIQIYYWLSRIRSNYSDSYLQFYVKMLKNAALRGEIGTSPENLHWGHLWFLAYLYFISLLTLPLLLYMKKDRGKQLISKLAKYFEKRGRIFLLAVPIVLSELTLRTKWPGYDALNLVNDWANVSAYLICFVYGFIIYSDERLRQSIKRSGKVALCGGLIASLVFLTLSFSGRGPVVGYNFRWMLFLVLRGVNSWFWIITILSFGMKYLNFKNRLLTYANEVAYPIYVIHLPISTIIAYHVVQWNIGVLLQYMTITLTTLLCSIIALEIFIRPINATRFLLGLKPKKISGLHPTNEAGG